MDLQKIIRIEMNFNFTDVDGSAQDSVKTLLSTLKNWEADTIISNRGGSCSNDTHFESVSIEIPITNTNEVKRIEDKITRSLDDGDFAGYVDRSFKIVYVGSPAPIIVEPEIV